MHDSDSLINGSESYKIDDGDFYNASATTSSNHDYMKHRRFQIKRTQPLKRAVLKSGELNIKKYKQFHFHDFILTLVNARWRWTIVNFTLSFICCWLFFACLWWLLAVCHGDLVYEDGNFLFQNSSDRVPCVTRLYSFTSCILFSIEIHTTIGYGSRTLTVVCPDAMLLMCLQSLFGMILQSILIGVIFAKITRPKHRTQTLLFSKNAVLNQRDRLLNIMFRVGNVRKARIIDIKVNAFLIMTGTKDLKQFYLNVTIDDCEPNSSLFFLPILVRHEIDKSSPFYNLSAKDFVQEKWEIVVTLEGIIESTGQTTQARSSYTSNEVLWGHRFVSVVSYNNKRKGYEIDYSKLDETQTIHTPLCSPKELNEISGLEYSNTMDYETVLFE